MKTGLVALALCLVAGAAQAQCFTPDQATTVLLKRHPDIRVVNLEDGPATAFMVSFNAIPDPSHFVADQVLVFIPPSPSSQVELILFLNGCMTKHGLMPKEAIMPLIGESG